MATLLPLRAITLDFWFTLFADQPGTERLRRDLRFAGLAAELRAHGLAFGEEQLAAADEATRAEHVSWQAAYLDKPVTEQVVYLLNRLRPGLAAEMDAATLATLATRFGEPTLLVRPVPTVPDLRAVLAALRERGLRIGLISNTGRTPGSMLRLLLEEASIMPYFETLSFSDEMGLAKPGPAIFARTLAALDVDPTSAAHVGDDQTLDVLGARNAGMASVLVRTNSPADPAVPPSAWIKTLDDLPAALDQLAATQARP